MACGMANRGQFFFGAVFRFAPACGPKGMANPLGQAHPSALRSLLKPGVLPFLDENLHPLAHGV